MMPDRAPDRAHRPKPLADATRIRPDAADRLADPLRATFERDPH
jgi:hypothetical protein